LKSRPTARFEKQDNVEQLAAGQAAQLIEKTVELAMAGDVASRTWKKSATGEMRATTLRRVASERAR
jgi:hypothetical protein